MKRLFTRKVLASGKNERKFHARHETTAFNRRGAANAALKSVIVDQPEYPNGPDIDKNSRLATPTVVGVLFGDMSGFGHLMDIPGTKAYIGTLGGATHWGSFMDRFIQRENLRHLRTLLAQTTEDAKRRQIMKLIEEEEAKTPGQERPSEYDGGRRF